jgi:cytochrome d ubiquinol oxidase subunit I
MTSLPHHVGGVLAQVAGAPVAQPDLWAARQQMAVSLGWHIVIACLGVGFPSLIVFTEWRARRRKDKVMLALARRWSRALGVLFPVGAVSGTILSFEFGILWPGLMGTFGGVFGVPFALEAFAFFIEAIFIGIYAYGWNRLRPRAHLLSGLPVIVSGILATGFVVTANAWMNDPTGFTVDPSGAVQITEPWAAVTTPGALVQFVHMLLAAFIVTGFLVAMVYVPALRRGSPLRYHRLAFAIPFTAAAIALPVQLFVGDLSVRWIAEHQPVKEAAAEAHFPTGSHAPEILFGIPQDDGSVAGGVSIPNGLSLLTGGSPDATVPGLDQIAPADRPPVLVTHWAFDIMVLTGSFLLLPAAWFGWQWWRRRRLPRQRLFWWLAIAAGPLAVLCLEAGWTTTEVGRQPWIVYGVMRTNQAVTSATNLRLGYYLLLAIYTGLTVTSILALRRLGRVPLPDVVLADEDAARVEEREHQREDEPVVAP